MVASSYVLAATVISALVFFVGMPLGRRGCILMGDMCVIVGSAIQASAMSMPHIIVGRVICGFGIGVSVAISSFSIPGHTNICQVYLQYGANLHGGDGDYQRTARSRSCCAMCMADHRDRNSVLDRLWVHSYSKSDLLGENHLLVEWPKEAQC